MSSYDIFRTTIDVLLIGVCIIQAFRLTDKDNEIRLQQNLADEAGHQARKRLQEADAQKAKLTLLKTRLQDLLDS